MFTARRGREGVYQTFPKQSCFRSTRRAVDAGRGWRHGSELWLFSATHSDVRRHRGRGKFVHVWTLIGLEVYRVWGPIWQTEGTVYDSLVHVFKIGVATRKLGTFW
jgi:hypothetical protein